MVKLHGSLSAMTSLPSLNPVTFQKYLRPGEKEFCRHDSGSVYEASFVNAEKTGSDFGSSKNWIVKNAVFSGFSQVKVEGPYSISPPFSGE